LLSQNFYTLELLLIVTYIPLGHNNCVEEKHHKPEGVLLRKPWCYPWCFNTSTVQTNFINVSCTMSCTYTTSCTHTISSTHAMVLSCTRTMVLLNQACPQLAVGTYLVYWNCFLKVCVFVNLKKQKRVLKKMAL